MVNYRLLIEYDGTRYYGWQRQPNQVTVQGKLEGVLSLMCGREVEVIGAGRTDAGVHARGMTANVNLETELGAEEIREYLNRYLPDDIAVLEVKEASPRFHARYNATGKTYCYTCFDGAVKPVFDRKYYTRLEEVPGTGFLQNMGRIMGGTRLEGGGGRMTVEEVRRVLESKERCKAGPTAPAQGLCLMRVDYD